MKKLTLDKCVQGFIDHTEKHLRKKVYSKPQMTNLMQKTNTKENKKGFCLLDKYNDCLCEHECNDNLYDDAAMSALKEAILESIRSYTRSKNMAVVIYKDFIEYLAQELGIGLIIELPAKIPETPFEVQVEIVKLLHHNPKKTSDVGSKLLISERSVTKYLKEMASDNKDEGLVVHGEKAQLQYSKEGTEYSYQQTMHPLVLLPSLREVIAMLQGLYLMQSGIMADYAYKLAQNTWNQLSKYGKTQIKKKSAQLGLSREWVVQLSKNTNVPIYKAEREIFLEQIERGDIDLGYLLKSERKVDITTLDDDGNEKVYHKCKIIKLDANNSRVYLLSHEHTHPDIDANWIVKVDGKSGNIKF